jgi:hypothetical protein
LLVAGSYRINPVKFFVWILICVILFLIVGARFHYTLDVVLAVYFSVTIFNAYHRIADDVLIGHRFVAVWLFDGLVIYPAIEWLEAPHLQEAAQAGMFSGNSRLMAQLARTTHTRRDGGGGAGGVGGVGQGRHRPGTPHADYHPSYNVTGEYMDAHAAAFQAAGGGEARGDGRGEGRGEVRGEGRSEGRGEERRPAVDPSSTWNHIPSNSVPCRMCENHAALGLSGVLSPPSAPAGLSGGLPVGMGISSVGRVRAGTGSTPLQFAPFNTGVDYGTPGGLGPSPVGVVYAFPRAIFGADGGQGMDPQYYSGMQPTQPMPENEGRLVDVKELLVKALGAITSVVTPTAKKEMKHPVAADPALAVDTTTSSTM